MAKKITFNPISNNFDYVNDTTKLEYDLSKKQSKDFDSSNGNLAIFDNNGQTTDSGKTIGKETITKNTYYVLRNINDDTQNVYCSEEPFSLKVGSVIYADKECTTEYGKVSYYMSGTIRIDTDTSIFWAIDYEPKEFVSTKRVATESAVVNFLKKSDWNQNDETATDYIKNRTHYETIAEHVEMTDNEYNAKVASGSTFVQVKMNNVTVESNEYLKDESSETGNRQEYSSILYSLSAGDYGNPFKNGTSTCKKIAINGIETTLEYLEHPQGSGSPFYDREGVLGDTFYGADGTADTTKTNLICCYGNGFMFKYYSHTYHDKGYFLYLIDKTIYGEAPYTIDFYFECEQIIKKLDKKFLPDGFSIPDAVENNVVTFATEGQLKDSGKKIGGEEFGEYEQIPVREVVANTIYHPEDEGKIYGYYIDYYGSYVTNGAIVYKEKECLTPIGKMMLQAPSLLYYFNTEGDVNSGLSSNGFPISSGTTVNYLTGKRIIDANTIATEKGVENLLTTFNLVTPKFKTGDVVYRTDVPNFHFGVMPWEDYVKNPTNDMSTKVPIGLVVDPVKRTFLFCELLDKYFCNSDNIETYFDGYTSFEDGSETFERIAALKGSSKAADIPAFYGLRNSSNPSSTIFYVKAEVAYVPALEEWKKAKEHLCTAFYGDDDSYAGFMDRLIALRDGTIPSSTLFIGIHAAGPSKLFYSQISTVGKTEINNGTFANAAFNMNGEMPHWDNAIDQYACCPVFGIYTEEEENA